MRRPWLSGGGAQRGRSPQRWPPLVSSLHVQGRQLREERGPSRLPQLPSERRGGPRQGGSRLGGCEPPAARRPRLPAACSKGGSEGGSEGGAGPRPQRPGRLPCPLGTLLGRPQWRQKEALPAGPGGPAPPLPGFRQDPLGCRARMEAGGKLEALVPWKSLAGTTPSGPQMGHRPIPPFLRPLLLSPVTRIPRRRFLFVCLLNSLCNGIPHPGFLRGSVGAPGRKEPCTRMLDPC